MGTGSFADFYRDQYGRTVRLAWLLVGSTGDAEDLTQDAFVEIERRWEDLRTPGAYLRTAIINRCRRWQRRQVLGRERLRRLQAEQVPELVEVPDPDDGLLEAVAALPYRQRTVIVARYWAGWSEAEIAGALGCRPGTVKSLASRALDRVRRALDASAGAAGADGEERTDPFGRAVAGAEVDGSPGGPEPVGEEDR